MSFKKGHKINLGRKLTEEIINKIIEKRKWYKHSEEAKRKIGISRRGKKHSEESKKKMSEARKGKTASIETKKKMSITRQGKPAYWCRDEKHPKWKGDNAGYTALHIWARRRLKKPEKCQKCNKIPKSKIGLDLANISQEYRREITDWEWLCRKCHVVQDGRTKNRSIKGTFIKRIKVCMIPQ